MGADFYRKGGAWCCEAALCPRRQGPVRVSRLLTHVIIIAFVAGSGIIYRVGVVHISVAIVMAIIRVVQSLTAFRKQVPKVLAIATDFTGYVL